MPFPVMLALTVGKKALGLFNKKQNAAGGSISQPKKPMSRANKVRLAAGFTATLVGIAFLLSILQVFAGTKPGMMESYSVFTLNTSRIGEGLLVNMTNKIQNFNLSSLHKRDEFLEPKGAVKLPVDLLTAVAGHLPLPTSGIIPDVDGTSIVLPTSLSAALPSKTMSDNLATITSAADVSTRDITSASVFITTRDVNSAINSLTSKASSAANSAENALSSKAASLESKVSSVQAAASSKISSAEAAASSAVNNAMKNVEGSIVKVANKAYHGAIDAMDLEAWYSIYISSTCSGAFAFKNGTNTTVGASFGNEPTHMVINSCESHSAMNPLSVIRVLFWIGAVFTGIGFMTSIVGIICPSSGKVAYATVGSLLAAFFFLGLASAVTHGVAIAARDTINGTFHRVDVSASVGKAVQLAWATTCLVLISIALWVGVKKWAGGLTTSSEAKPEKESSLPWTSFGKSKSSRPDRTSGIAMGPVISAPMPAYDDRRTQQWI